MCFWIMWFPETEMRSEKMRVTWALKTWPDCRGAADLWFLTGWEVNGSIMCGHSFSSWTSSRTGEENWDQVRGFSLSSAPQISSRLDLRSGLSGKSPEVPQGVIWVKNWSTLLREPRQYLYPPFKSIKTRLLGLLWTTRAPWIVCDVTFLNVRH